MNTNRGAWRGPRFLRCVIRKPEKDLIEALKKFPDNLLVMWMITPTMKGVNVDAIPLSHTRTRAQLEWYDNPGGRFVFILW